MNWRYECHDEDTPQGDCEFKTSIFKETVALQKQAWFSLLNAEQMSVVSEIFKLRQLTDTIGSRVNIPKEFESFEVG